MIPRELWDETVVLIPRNLDGVEPGMGDPLVPGESDMRVDCH
jgi:hypothetical protein